MEKEARQKRVRDRWQAARNAARFALVIAMILEVNQLIRVQGAVAILVGVGFALWVLCEFVTIHLAIKNERPVPSALPEPDLPLVVPQIEMPIAGATVETDDTRPNPWETPYDPARFGARHRPDLTAPHFALPYDNHWWPLIRAEFWLVNRRSSRRERFIGYVSPALPVALFALNSVLRTLKRHGGTLPYDPAVMQEFRSLLPMMAFWLVGITLLALATQGDRIKKRFPPHGVLRAGVATLTPAGLYNRVGAYPAFAPWPHVEHIFFHRGDFFLCYRDPDTDTPKEIVLARTGFPDPETARRFHDAALTLWRSEGREIPAILRRPDPVADIAR